jgi:hypothetical protein
MPDFESVNDGREIPLKGSLLELFVRRGMPNSRPEVTEHLAMPTQNIAIPDLKRVLAWSDIVEAYQKEQYKRVIPPADIPFAEEIAYFRWNAEQTNKVPPVVPPLPSRLRPRKRAEAKFIRELEDLPDIPPALLERYEGLSRLETGFAFSQFSVSSRVANKDYHGDLVSWLEKEYAKAGLTQPVRLVVLDSDMPTALALNPHNSEPRSIIITTNVLEMLPERQLHAVLRHEISHMMDNKDRNVRQMMRQARINKWTANQQLLFVEDLADKRSVRLGSPPEDMVDGLTTMLGRIYELKRFAQQLERIGFEHKMLSSELPLGLQCMLQFSAIEPRIRPEATFVMQAMGNLRDPHPPFETRFAALYEEEANIAKRQAEGKAPKR